MAWCLIKRNNKISKQLALVIIQAKFSTTFKEIITVYCTNGTNINVHLQVEIYDGKK
jgi:hypothetical protein